jgi:mRNA-degrading endonuclease RelE of RelBE toxin-antitoxin system
MAEMLVFIETRLFTRLADKQLSDDELSRLQHYLNENPEAGDIIRDSGGVRKLRWGVRGRGKRGGFRIIYFLRSQQGEIWLLTLYAKNMAASISGHVLRKIKEEIDG